MSERRKLTEQEIQEALDNDLEGWTIEDGKLYKQFKFDNFAQALGWMVTAGVAADKMDHHPEWSNVYNTVTVNLVTHDLDNSIGTSDVKLARKMDAIA